MTKHELRYDAADESGTRKLAHALADCLPCGSVVVLTGTLGAGKTALVRYFSERCGIDPTEITSPTYVLCQEYFGKRSIQHLDVYRLNNPAEFGDLGPDEIFASADVSFVEWGEQVIDYLPEDRIEIRIEITGPTSRSFHITILGYDKSLKECLFSR